jgi:DHA1 family bicyclomycin/chloramphenicol resistance-like MFS transporter
MPETLAPENRHGGGFRGTARTFSGLMADGRFSPYAVSFSLSFGAMFAYIAGSSFVLEDVFGASPQAFSLVFAINSAGLIAMSQVGSRLVSRRGAAALVRDGLRLVALASAGTLIVTAVHGALAPLLVCLFALLCGNGLVLPNGVAAAMADQSALGSASALLGVGQFGVGAAVAPLVGLGGSHDALPMGIVIAACGLSALAVNLAFAPPVDRPPHRVEVNR